MNKTYIIAPLILLAIFVVFYFNFTKEYEQREAERLAEVARVEAEEVAKKRAAEVRAKEDAERRAAERESEAAQKEAEKRAKWEEAARQIAESTDNYDAEADRFAERAAELEMKLVELRKQREQASAEAFDLQKQVSLAQIAKRNAELEVQRMTEMISRRAAESALVRPPTPVAATASR